MGTSNTVYIENIGTVMFARRRRTRHLTLALQPSGALRVTVPYGVAYKEAASILSSNTGWVKRYLARMKKARQRHFALMAGTEDISDDHAAEKITARLEELAKRHGFHYNRLFIRRQRTRWSSCSPNNNISINIKLARLPDELIDYVLLHELLHTRVKSHGSRFWRDLDSILGDARALDARLKNYNLDLLGRSCNITSP